MEIVDLACLKSPKSSVESNFLLWTTVLAKEQDNFEEFYD